MFSIIHKSVHVFVLFVVIGCTGCSAMLRVTSLRSDDKTASTAAAIAGAEMIPIKTRVYHYNAGVYEFKIDKASITFCPSVRKFDVISVGPLLLPIFPVLMGEPEPETDRDRIKRQERLQSVVFGIDGIAAQVELDFSELHLYQADGVPVRVLSISALQSDRACFDLSRYPFTKSNDLLGKRITVKGDSIFYQIIFDPQAGVMSGLIVDLGILKIAGKKVKLPPLEYRERTKYYYAPYFFPMPH